MYYFVENLMHYSGEKCSYLIDIALEALSLHHHAPNNLPVGVLTNSNYCSAVHSVAVDYPRYISH